MKKTFLIAIFLFAPVFAFADDASSTPATSTPPIEIPSTATLTIRDGDITAFTGTADIAASTSPAVDIAPTNASTTVAVSADSLLATLVALDATTSDFNITDLGYFSSFNSFIINCIAIPAASKNDCFNWTYAVNGEFPQVGANHETLHDGDVVYLFFGPQRQTTLSTTTAAVGESFTATAEHYDLASGAYVPSPNLTLGVGTPNPDYSFTELATSTSDANGQAIFTLHATGTYAVGIQEDSYFPAASITITEAATTATSTVSTSTPPVNNPPPSGGGGGAGISHQQLNVANALAYLVSKQHADGSFDNWVLTDWAAITFAASSPGDSSTKLRAYLVSSSPTLQSATDYERHAMALEALGINPYSGTAINYIAPVVAGFDGTQVGDPSLDNDDIFALFPLLHAGYSASDDIIQKTVAFIVSRQQSDGSWDGSSDVTAAAIQALSPLSSLPNVSAAISKAESYLHAQQQGNGGWGNSFSTSWALQAIAALNESVSNWAPGGLNPNDYLASLQQSDGGVEPISSDANTRVWATEYAIPASLGKPWNSLLQSFSKPTSATSGGGVVLGASTSTAAIDTAATSTVSATSTMPTVATSTPPVATSTLEILGTSTTTAQTTQTSPPPKPISKKVTPKIQKVIPEPPPAIPQAATNQTAAAASVPAPSFLGKLWHAITSFFASLF